jgi:CheY-like chemotaxis protein
MLADHGYEVTALTTSDEAYTLLKQWKPGLILCDVNLETSTMGGFSFYEKIRQLEHLQQVPFMFLTGLSDDVLIRTGKELGVDDYLTKPISEENLVAAIKGKLKRFGEMRRKP